MTREQAIETVYDFAPGCPSKNHAEMWVETFERLGMLKLDEPKILPQKLRDFVGDARLAQGDAMQRLENLQSVLREYGLNIVEK